MDKIIVEKNPTQEKLEGLGVSSWPTWNCGISEFDWTYDDTETCYFLEGHVVVESQNQKVEVNKGDIAIFPKGLKCTWRVTEPVKKVYKFG